MTLFEKLIHELAIRIWPTNTKPIREETGSHLSCFITKFQKKKKKDTQKTQKPKIEKEKYGYPEYHII